MPGFSPTPASISPLRPPLVTALCIFAVLAGCGDSGTAPAEPSVVLGSASIALQAPAAGATQTSQLAITNGGGGSLGSLTVDVTYEVAQEEDWLEVALDSPSNPTSLSISATPPVRPGTYVAAVGVSEESGSSAEVRVEFTVSARPLLYLIDQQGDMLRRLDPVTMTMTDVGPLGVEFSFGDCTWEPGTGALIATDGRPNNTLLEVSLSTGAATAIGTHSIDDLCALEAHSPSQSLVGSSRLVPRTLYRLDRASAEPTEIGEVGQRIAGLGWDTSRQVMIGSGSNVGPDGGSLFTIDLETGAPTLFGSLPPINNHGMTYDPSRDLFWAADVDGQILTIDPTNGFAASIMATLQGQNACIAYVP